MLSRMLATIAERGLLARGDAVLVGYSGGPDSTALLAALCQVRDRLGITVEAACVDHGLRPESASEAALAVERARAFDVSVVVLRVDVRGHRGPHVSWQDAARRGRLAALETHARERGLGKIALGHTADDQAETVLFRILRGTGVRGLAGIPYVRGPFVRPLLDVRRREIESWLRRRKVPFVQDPSNLDARFARSRIRHQILPILGRENPKIVEALISLAADARADATDEFRSLPRGVRTAVARARAAGGSRRIDAAGGVIEVRYGSTTLRPRAAVPDHLVAPLTIACAGTYQLRRGDQPIGPLVEITLGQATLGRMTLGQGTLGEITLGQGTLEITLGQGTLGEATLGGFDADVLAWPLVLRTRRPGDRMRPRGGNGTRKLQDLLVDAKVPRFDRDDLPVLCTSHGEILYVPGLRPSEHGRATDRTRRHLTITVRSAGTLR